MCALLRSVEYHFTVVPNQKVEVYSDPELTNPVPAYILGDIPRGESRTATMYVKNLGEPVSLDVTVNTPYAVVSPSSISLAADEVKQVDLLIEVPFSAPLETVDGVIEFNAAGAS